MNKIASWAKCIVEPLAALFEGLSATILHRRTQSMSLYGHKWFNSQQRLPSPPFLSMYVIYLWCEVRNE